MPNSAPDSFTPKNWNFVRVPEHKDEDADGAVEVDVPDGTVLALTVVVGVVAVDGWHCE